MRGYEERHPLADKLGAGAVFAAFAPQTIFSNTDSLWVAGTLSSNFSAPADIVADLTGNGYLGNLISACQGCLKPRFVVDPTSPNALAAGVSSGVPPTLVSVPAPQAPSGARIFDSFSRANSTYAFDRTGGLGSTEGGAAGAQVWRSSEPNGQPASFGILNNRAVVLANESRAAWVPTGSTTGNLEVRVDRSPGTWESGLNTGLVFRFSEANPRNFFFAYTSSSAAKTSLLTVGYFLNGVRTNLVVDAAMPQGWTTLRVVTLNTGSINVYADATPIYSTLSSVLVNSTGAGLWNNGPGLGLTNRWDNFTVFEIR